MNKSYYSVEYQMTNPPKAIGISFISNKNGKKNIKPILNVIEIDSNKNFIYELICDILNNTYD